MPMQSVDDLFLSWLSDVHVREQRMAQVWEQLSQTVQDPEVKNLLSTRAYLDHQDAANIQKCFQLLGKQPPPPNTQVYETLAQNIRSTFDAIGSPGLQALYAFKTAHSASNWAIGEYTALAAMAAAGNEAVASLLQHNLADKLEFVEHRQDVIRERIAEGQAGRVAKRTV